MSRDWIVIDAKPPGVRPVVGLPVGYWIGRDGSFWSQRERRAAGRGNGSTSVIGTKYRKLKGFQGNEKNPYPSVVIRINGRPVKKQIHTMVLEAFRGPCPPGKEARHRDGNPRNNRLGNLIYGTCRQNAADRKKHGTLLRGEEVGNSTLSESLVKRIRNRHGNGESVRSLSRRFRKPESTIRHVVKRRSWRHLP